MFRAKSEREYSGATLSNISEKLAYAKQKAAQADIKHKICMERLNLLQTADNYCIINNLK